jgi:excisionase family DNA binding protein
MIVMEKEDTFLTTSEVAKELRVSSVTVQKLLGTGELKGTRVGKVWRIKKSDLIVYVNRNTNIQEK